MINVIPCNQNNRKQTIQFLEYYQETALFLLGNLIEFGPKLRDYIYSGNFYLLLKNNDIVGVFCFCRNGSVLIQTDNQENYNELILKACLEEKRPITGVLGDWKITKTFWDSLKFQFPNLESLRTQKDFLYRLDLDQIPNSKPNPNIRFLNSNDFDDWKKMQQNFSNAINLSVENSKEIFKKNIDQKHLWGLFLDQELVSMAAFNVTYKKLGQIGGVYTKTECRNFGFSTQVMKQLILDSKNIHHLNTLILFTGEENIAAQKVYEKVGFQRIGDFGIFYGK